VTLSAADRHRLRLGALALPLVAAGALAPVALAAGHAAHAAGAPPACTTSQLVPTVGSANGAAGTIYMTLSFANVGSACTLRGFPGVQAVARDGSSLGNAARITNGTTVKTITVKGARAGNFPVAKATLGIVDTGALPNCKTTAAVALKVTPPNQTTSKTVPLAFLACGHGPSVLNIRPVTG
jgi:hypothetical protein